MAPLVPQIVSDALRASAHSNHEWGCERITFIRDRVNRYRTNATRLREAARVEAIREAPPCTCHVALAAAALVVLERAEPESE